MTRINVGIPPSELNGQMLIAEHREIKRIPNMVKSGKAKIVNIPPKFTLGTGHVKFFYDKLKYLRTRYIQIYNECIKRGYNVQSFLSAFDDIPDSLFNDYIPTATDIRTIRERITIRLGSKK